LNVVRHNSIRIAVRSYRRLLMGLQVLWWMTQQRAEILYGYYAWS
jgi:hypothetical protein